MGSRIRSIAVNLTIVIVAVGLLYGVASLVMFRFAPEISPVLLRNFPVDIRVLGQSLKAERVPEDYVAIIGDSYAEGLGDWLASEGRTPGGRYSAAHVLHDLTGRDVVSFGESGASSAHSMVLLTTGALASGACAALTGIPEPAHAYVYFYEGNDLRDNVFFLYQRVGTTPDDPDLAGAVDRYLQEGFGRISGMACLRDLGDALFEMGRVAYASVARSLSGRSDPAQNRTARNRVILRDGEALAPDRTDIPTAYLTEAQTEAGMTVFDLSLRWLKERLPATTLTLVYLPAPAVTYRYADPVITLGEGQQDFEIAVPNLMAASDSICERVRRSAMANGVRFIDARPALRAAAAVDFIHGPRDWVHLNQIGYTALGTFLAAQLGGSESDPDCDGAP